MEESDTKTIIDNIQVDVLDSLKILEINVQENMEQMKVKDKIQAFERDLSEIENSVEEISTDLVDAVRSFLILNSYSKKA